MRISDWSSDVCSSDLIVTEETKGEMKRVLEDIQSGRFARDWVTECRAGQPSFKAMRRRSAEHSIEEVGAKLRGMMPLITANQPVDQSSEERRVGKECVSPCRCRRCPDH